MVVPLVVVLVVVSRLGVPVVMHRTHLFLTLDSVQQSSGLLPNLPLLLGPVVSLFLDVVLLDIVSVLHLHVESILLLVLLQIVDVDVDRSQPRVLRMQMVLRSTRIGIIVAVVFIGRVLFFELMILQTQRLDSIS